MPRVIWKFRLEPRTPTVTIPRDAEFLSVQLVGGELCLYAAVDPGVARVTRIIYGIMTGEDVPADGKKYLGTTQQDAPNLPGGVFVLHWFSTH